VKREIFILFFYFTALCISKSQNLVPNYSFEHIIKCTTGVGEFNGYVSDWTGQAGDISGLSYCTHQCSGDSAGGGSVPYNIFDGSYHGFQYAHTGVSYGSIITFIIGLPSDTTYPYGSTMFANNRNYMQVQLTDSLKAGATYYVTFFVSLVNGSWFACNDMGVYFSKNAPPFNSKGTVLNYVPQVANNFKKQELTDTVNWMKISGNFIAKGGENYITIGNFKNDSASSIRYLGQPSPDGGEAWYYIDDVIVSADSNYADSLMGVAQLIVNNEKVIVYPNPASTLLNVEVGLANGQTGTICMYSSLGEKVICEEITQHITILPINTLVPGIYYYRITDENSKLIKADKVMIVH